MNSLSWPLFEGRKRFSFGAHGLRFLFEIEINFRLKEHQCACNFGTPRDKNDSGR